MKHVSTFFFLSRISSTLHRNNIEMKVFLLACFFTLSSLFHSLKQFPNSSELQIKSTLPPTQHSALSSFGTKTVNGYNAKTHVVGKLCHKYFNIWFSAIFRWISFAFYAFRLFWFSIFVVGHTSKKAKWFFESKSTFASFNSQKKFVRYTPN